jgi:DNA-binding transcriptional LysR family regulator
MGRAQASTPAPAGGLVLPPVLGRARPRRLSGVSSLPEVLVVFAARYPLVSLDFALTNQHSNLVDGGFDVALRATAKLEDSSLVARKLGTIEQRLYASPRYLQARGTPRSWRELDKHACVVFRARDLARTWSLRGPSGQVDVPVRGAIGGDDFTFVRAMVLQDAGIALLPHVNAASDEASGRLVRVLPELHAAGATLYLVYPSAKNVPPRVAAVRDFLAERLAG